MKKTSAFVLSVFVSLVCYAFNLEEPVINRDLIRSIALKAAETGGVSSARVGNNIYTATFNGYRGSCASVSVVHTVDGIKGNERIYNYSICNGQITYSGTTATPSFAVQQRPEVIKNVVSSCRFTGFAAYTDELGRTVECRSMDIQRCMFELVYYDEAGMMVKKEAINICK